MKVWRFPFKAECAAADLVAEAEGKGPGHEVRLKVANLHYKDGSDFCVAPAAFPNGISNNGAVPAVNDCVFGISLLDGAAETLFRVGLVTVKIIVMEYGSYRGLYFVRGTQRFLVQNTIIAFGDKDHNFDNPKGLNIHSLAMLGTKIELNCCIEVRKYSNPDRALLPRFGRPPPSPTIGEAHYEALQGRAGSKRSTADFTLVSEQDGQRLPCHSNNGSRSFLAHASDYFRDVVFGTEDFTTPEGVKMKAARLDEEANEGLPTASGKMGCFVQKAEAHLNFSGETLGEILHWTYLGRPSAHFPDEKFEEFMTAVDFLLMTHLLPHIRYQTKERLRKNLNADNARQKLSIAQKFGFKVISSHARKHLVAITNHDSFKKIILKGPASLTLCQGRVYGVLHIWIGFGSMNRPIKKPHCG